MLIIAGFAPRHLAALQGCPISRTLDRDGTEEYFAQLFENLARWFPEREIEGTDCDSRPAAVRRRTGENSKTKKMKSSFTRGRRGSDRGGATASARKGATTCNRRFRVLPVS